MSSGPHDFIFITPEQAVEIDIHTPKRPLAFWQKLARKNKKCEVCGQPAWRFVDAGLCFMCTTGETDASNDYELILDTANR